MMRFICQTLDDIDAPAREIRALIDAGKTAAVVITIADRQRSLPQNASLHLYCDTVAGKMNDAGYTQRQLVGKFRDGFELPVTMHMIKDIFREVGKAMFKKESTKELNTIEIQEVYKVVDQRLGEITGVRAEWPSQESMMMRELNGDKA